MKIEFTAILSGAGCLRFDDDGSSVVKLTIDGSQMANAVKLLTLQGQVFTVSIDTRG